VYICDRFRLGQAVMLHIGSLLVNNSCQAASCSGRGGPVKSLLKGVASKITGASYVMASRKGATYVINTIHLSQMESYAQ
jgi:hypothetical protein